MWGPRSIAKATGLDALLGAALDSMPYGFSVWSEKRGLIAFNEQYLKLYRYPKDRVRIGQKLFDICKLSIEVGNHPGMSAEELFESASRHFDTTMPGRAVEVQKEIGGRVILTSHVRSPGVGWIMMHEDVTAEVEQRVRAEEREARLAEQNLRFDAALAHMSQGLAMYDAERRLVICNDRYREMYGLPPALCRPGTPLAEIAAFRKAQGVVPVGAEESLIQQVLDETSRNQTRVQAHRMPDGRVISVTQSPMGDGGFVTTHADVTRDVMRFAAVEERERDLKVQNLRFNAAVNNMSQGLCMFDANERLVVCNEPYARLYNLPPELMRPGTTMLEILEFRFAHGMVPKQGRERYVESRQRLVRDQVDAKDEIEMEDGRVIAINHHPMPGGGWVATHEDVTEQRRIEERIRHLARHDALTDLPNRTFLREEMERLEARIRRHETVAVLCLDLDHFKSVNDTLGHGIGDKVLVMVGARLTDCVRETDTVARLGGDEFAILVPALEDPAEAAVVASRIVQSISKPMEIDGHHISVGTSIGIAVAPSDGQDADTLLKNADLALYRAKGEGRGNYHFFEKDMDKALQHRRLLEQGLKVALAEGQFRLMYQPLMDLSQNRICCCEALLRWDHPAHGAVPPSEFVPIAEEIGVMTTIGEWVLREACRTAAAWPAHVRVAVNLSAAQFKSRALFQHVVTALDEAELPAARLELEVTESLLLADTAQTLETLHRLRALGVGISMDDFGTGYSSLSYLRAFPFDKIKIDRSFLNGVGPHDNSLAIIRAVIALGQSLGMSTTAEGIETEEQLAALRAQGCNEVQGYLFSPPLPALALADLFASASEAEPAERQRA